MPEEAQMPDGNDDQSEVIWQVVDDEALIIDASSGEFFSLNPVGTEVWQGLHRGDSLAQIAELISQKYGIEPDVVHGDVTELIEDLRAAKLWQ